ncbi:MAG: sugar ABC transporter permease, partial [Clostridiales bacterium]
MVKMIKKQNKEQHQKWNKELNPLKRDKLIGMAFLWPSLIGVLVFFVLPFGVVCFYSVINNPVQHDFVFLDNFIKLLQNSSFRTAAYNTARFSAVAVPLAVGLALGLAIILECRIPGKSQFRTFFLS